MKKKPPLPPTASRPVPEPQRCTTCRQIIAVCDGIHYGSPKRGYRDLCSRCFNEEVARDGGLDFEHVEFQPIQMRDADGGQHEFHFRVHLLGDRVSLDALELQNGQPQGYQFQVIGDAEEDLFTLMGQLTQRMRRALALRHLEFEKQFGWVIADTLVRARITWDDEENGRVPLLVIDGREVTWEKFGRMLMGFEGWQFKLEIRDRSEEV